MAFFKNVHRLNSFKFEAYILRCFTYVKKRTWGKNRNGKANYTFVHKKAVESYTYVDFKCPSLFALSLNGTRRTNPIGGKALNSFGWIESRLKSNGRTWTSTKTERSRAKCDKKSLKKIEPILISLLDSCPLESEL